MVAVVAGGVAQRARWRQAGEEVSEINGLRGKKSSWWLVGAAPAPAVVVEGSEASPVVRKVVQEKALEPERVESVAPVFNDPGGEATPRQDNRATRVGEGVEESAGVRGVRRLQAKVLANGWKPFGSAA